MAGRPFRGAPNEAAAQIVAQGLPTELNYQILAMFPLADIIAICNNPQHQTMCQSESFWEWVAAYHFPWLRREATNTWRQLVTFLIAAQAEPEGLVVLQGAAQLGNQSILAHLLAEPGMRQHANMALVRAIRAGNTQLVPFLIQQGANNWDAGLIAAAYIGDRPLVDMFIAHATREYTHAAAAAAETGNTSLLDYLANQGHVAWEYVLVAAIEYNQPATADYIAQYYPVDWNRTLSLAARAGNIPVLQYCLAHGATRWDWALLDALDYDQPEVIQYVTTHHQFDWNAMLRQGAASGEFRLVEFSLARGATDLIPAIMAARANDDEEMAAYLKAVLEEREAS